MRLLNVGVATFGTDRFALYVIHALLDARSSPRPNNVDEIERQALRAWTLTDPTCR